MNIENFYLFLGGQFVSQFGSKITGFESVKRYLLTPVGKVIDKKKASF